MRRIFVVLITGFAVLVFSALQVSCSSLTKIVEKPKVDLQSVGLASPDAKGATLVFNLNVENPNAVALELSEVAYDLMLDGRQFAKGTLDKGVNVPAKKAAVVAVPVRVEYTDLYASVLQLMTAKATNYTLEGSVRSGLLTVPFSKSGEVKLSDLIDRATRPN